MNRPGVFQACSSAIVALSSAQVNNHHSDHRVSSIQHCSFALHIQQRNIPYRRGVIKRQRCNSKKVMQHRRDRVGQELQVV